MDATQQLATITSTDPYEHLRQNGVAMGTRYMEVTRTCLEVSFAGMLEDSGDGRDSWYMPFKTLVMGRIKIERGLMPFRNGEAG